MYNAWHERYKQRSELSNVHEGSIFFNLKGHGHEIFNFSFIFINQFSQASFFLSLFHCRQWRGILYTLNVIPLFSLSRLSC